MEEYQVLAIIGFVVIGVMIYALYTAVKAAMKAYGVGYDDAMVLMSPKPMALVLAGTKNRRLVVARWCCSPRGEGFWQKISLNPMDQDRVMVNYCTDYDPVVVWYGYLNMTPKEAHQKERS